MPTKRCLTGKEQGPSQNSAVGQEGHRQWERAPESRGLQGEGREPANRHCTDIYRSVPHQRPPDRAHRLGKGWPGSAPRWGLRHQGPGTTPPGATPRGSPWNQVALQPAVGRLPPCGTVGPWAPCTQFGKGLEDGADGSPPNPPTPESRAPHSLRKNPVNLWSGPAGACPGGSHTPTPHPVGELKHREEKLPFPAWQALAYLPRDTEGKAGSAGESPSSMMPDSSGHQGQSRTPPGRPPPAYI